MAGEPLRERLGGHLDALRLSTVELRAESHLAMGLHERVVADLTALADEHPERERIVAAQMTALYRSDRAAEAVRLYRVTRRALSTRLGVEPGPDLNALHQRVLRRDPALDRPPAPLYAVRVGEHWLPWNTSGHPALEFCNTYAGWGGPELAGSEWLRDYATLAVWAGHLDLAEDHVVTRLLARARRDPGEAAAVLAQARDFRALLYACLTDPADTGAFKAVAEVAEAAAKSSVFTLGADGLGRWRIPLRSACGSPPRGGPQRRRPAGGSAPSRGARLPQRRVRLAVPGRRRPAQMVQPGDVRRLAATAGRLHGGLTRTAAPASCAGAAPNG